MDPALYSLYYAIRAVNKEAKVVIDLLDWSDMLRAGFMMMMMSLMQVCRWNLIISPFISELN